MRKMATISAVEAPTTSAVLCGTPATEYGGPFELGESLHFMSASFLSSGVMENFHTTNAERLGSEQLDRFTHLFINLNVSEINSSLFVLIGPQRKSDVAFVSRKSGRSKIQYLLFAVAEAGCSCETF